ncbi:UNVERIFIED_CONTAM: hypothetical protein GTU68_055084 [Idotea baltica]|nr:hypothetical protein [Idotea baltica]
MIRCMQGIVKMLSLERKAIMMVRAQNTHGPIVL